MELANGATRTDKARVLEYLSENILQKSIFPFWRLLLIHILGIGENFDLKILKTDCQYNYHPYTLYIYDTGVIYRIISYNFPLWPFLKKCYHKIIITNHRASRTPSASPDSQLLILLVFGHYFEKKTIFYGNTFLTKNYILSPNLTHKCFFLRHASYHLTAYKFKNLRTFDFLSIIEQKHI